jgi:hypothetical protein
MKKLADLMRELSDSYQHDEDDIFNVLKIIKQRAECGAYGVDLEFDYITFAKFNKIVESLIAEGFQVKSLYELQIRENRYKVGVKVLWK